MLPMLLLATALAEVPHRCEAVFDGPTESCALFGTWAATGTGPSQSQASRNALRRLDAALAAGLDARAESLSEVEAAMLRGLGACARVEDAQVFCFAGPALAEPSSCLASLREPDCGDVAPVWRTGPAWLGMEQGRSELCRALDSELVRTGRQDGQRSHCQARCQQQARVFCTAASRLSEAAAPDRAETARDSR